MGRRQLVHAASGWAQRDRPVAARQAETCLRAGLRGVLAFGALSTPLLAHVKGGPHLTESAPAARALPPHPPFQATQNQHESRCRAWGPASNSVCDPVSVSRVRNLVAPRDWPVVERRVGGLVGCGAGPHNQDASRRRVPVRAWSVACVRCTLWTVLSCGRGGPGEGHTGGPRLVMAGKT